MWKLITAYNPLVLACVCARMSAHMYVLLAIAVIQNTINNHFDFPPSVDQIDFLGLLVHLVRCASVESIKWLWLCSVRIQTKSSHMHSSSWLWLTSVEQISSDKCVCCEGVYTAQLRGVVFFQTLKILQCGSLGVWWAFLTLSDRAGVYMTEYTGARST